MRMTEVSAQPTFCSYAEFGERFFEFAVTEERILHAFDGLAGNAVEFGPIGVGPGKMAQVAATGTVGSPSISRRSGQPVSFRLIIPVELAFTVNLVGDRRYHAEVEIRLDLTARAAEPLRVFIDVAPPTKDNVVVRLRSEGLRSELLRQVADIDREVQRFIAKYVAREIDKPKIRAARDIDVAARMDGAWRS